MRDACPPANELIAAVMQCSMDAAAEEEVEEGCRWVIYAIKTRHVTFRLTLGSRGDVATILQMGFSSSLHTIIVWGLAVKLLSCEPHGASLMRSQHWYRYWLVAVRQQAIIWTNADPDLWHLASLCHNELNIHPCEKCYGTIFFGISYLSFIFCSLSLFLYVTYVRWSIWNMLFFIGVRWLVASQWHFKNGN